MVIEDLVKAVMGELRKIAQTETVVGQPIILEETTIIPVTKLSMGFMVGGGEKKGKQDMGEATGGGASIEPIAFFVVRGEKIDLVTLKKDGSVLADMMDLVPQLIEKVRDVRGRSKAPESKKKDKP